MAEIHCLNI